MTNKKNIYNCPNCGNTIVTEDEEKGTTPFMLICSNYNGCNEGMMTSAMYNIPPHFTASHVFYKPDKEEMKNLNEGELYHVKQGGLLLKKK